MTTIGDFTKTLDNDIIKYNENYNYIDFEPSYSLLGTPYLTIPENSNLGCIPIDENNANSIGMTLFDNNLYDLKTAGYNVGMYFANLKWQQEQGIRNGSIRINPKKGLQSRMYPEYFDLDVNYFMIQDQDGIPAVKNIHTNVSQLSGQPGEKYSVEWFGYFKSNTSGNFHFKISNQTDGNQNSYIWFGDDALVNYNDKNFIIKNYGKTRSESPILPIIAGKYYPIRIQYGHKTGQYSFNLEIFNENTRVSNDEHLFSLTDGNNQPYESMQMYFSLRNDMVQNNSKKQTNNLYNCYISPVDINNNFLNNEKIRIAKSVEKIEFGSVPFAPVIDTNQLECSFYISPEGNLVFSQGGNTNTLAINTKKTTDYQNCNTIMNKNVDIRDVSIKTLDGKNREVDITNYFNKSSNQTKDSASSYDYTINSYTFNTDMYFQEVKNKKIDLDLDTDTEYDASHNQVYAENSWNRPIDYTIKYRIGDRSNPLVNTQGQTSQNNPIRINNQAMAVQKAQTMNLCSFYIKLNNDGTITMFDGTNRQVQDLNWSPEYSKILEKVPQTIVSVKKWIRQYKKTPNKDIMKMESRLQNQSQYLLSANGKFKLVINNNNLVLKYAKEITCPLNSSSNTYYTNNDGSNIFFLYNITADEKLGKTFIENKSTATLSNLPISPILTYTNQYKAVDGINYPPNQVLSTIQGKPNEYVKTENKNSNECQEICNQTDGCNHYYSYVENGKTNCIVNNNNGKNVKYFPNVEDTNITSSNLYIRNKMIQSTCQYSLTNPRIGGVEKINLKINPVKNTEYASYTNAYSVSKDMDPSLLIPSREGACGDPSIFDRLSKLVGKNDDLLATQATKESFVSGYNTNSCRNLTGSNGGIISSCITDLSNNIQAISNYDNTIYKGLNQKINQNYLDISNVATDIINQRSIINGTSTETTTEYDPIDFDGNVMFGKTKKLKDAYLQDIQDSIFQQENLYMIGSITAATLFITAILIGRNL